MKRVSVAELKARLSEYLGVVKAGEEIVVTDHGTPVAQLVPLRAELARDTRLAKLMKGGLIRPGTGKLPPDFFSRQPPAGPAVDAARLVREERDEGW